MQSRLFNCILLLLVIFSPAVALGSENSSELYQKGVKEFQQGNIEQAEALFRKVILISPHYTLGYYGLGRVYLTREKDMSQAVKMFRKSVNLDRRYARAWFYLGMASYLDNRFMEALHAYKEAYRLDSSQVEALYNMGVIYDRMNRTWHASYYFRRYKDEKQKEESDIIF